MPAPNLKYYFPLYFTIFLNITTTVSFGQTKKEWTWKYDSLKHVLDSSNKLIETLINDTTKKSNAINTLEEDKKRLSATIDAYKAKKPPPVIPLTGFGYSFAGKQCWASNNLSEKEVKELFGPEIIDAKDSAAWISCFKNNKPAFCYHRDDPNKAYGVLLNKSALVLLYKKLDHADIAWRLPSPEDIDTLTKTLLMQKNGSLVSALISSTNSITPHWRKPGYDLFNLHIPPLSYRRNTSREWFGADVASFYCYNKEDDKLEKTLLIAEINDSDADKNTIAIKEKDLTDDFNNFGVFVRLIKK